MRRWCLPVLAATLSVACRTSLAAPAVDFALKNSGDQPLEITKVFAICKCTQVLNTPIPKVAPGKPAKIEIAFDSAGLRGRVTKRVLVKTNDPAHEKMLLTVQADVQPIAILTPDSVNFGSIRPNGRYETTVIVAPATAKPFKVLKVIPGVHSSAAACVPVKDGKGSYRLTVVVQAGSESARVMDELKIVTDLPGNPSISLLVYGNVEKEVTKDAAGP